MTRTIIAALALAVLATEASAQSRSYCDACGKRIGSASTDNQGTTTCYGAGGKVTGRTSPAAT